MTTVILFFAVVIGVCMGSFGNVLIDRLPRGESIIGRSHCDTCKRSLAPQELIPLLSWVFLRGKCRTCGAHISARLPLVEATSGLLAAIAYALVQDNPETNGSFLLAALLFVGLWALLLIAVIDFRTRTIPDALTVIVFIAGIVFHWFRVGGSIPTLAPLILGLFFLSQWLISRGQWVGTGDILLAAAIGMLVGTVQGALWTLILAYAFGASVAIVLLSLKKLRRGDMIPFGPFLVLGAYVVIILGDSLAPIPLG